MILRKPYAFLIKNFRLIHLIIFGLSLFLISATNSILNFCKDYINVGLAIVQPDLAQRYVYGLLYVFLVIIIVSSLIIFVLLRQKDKPRKMYLFIIFVYFIMAGYFIFMGISLRDLEINGVGPQTIRLYRDVTIIMNMIQAVMVIFLFIRAFGFDIRKFNFSGDLSKLEVEEKDREEFELSIDVNNQKFMRKLRRQAREYKYFYLENKNLLQLLFGIALLITMVVIVLQLTVFRSVYSQDTTINYSGLSLKVKESKYTERNYLGKTIGKNKRYVLVTLNIVNNTDQFVELDNISMELLSKNFLYLLKKNVNDQFIDVGSLFENNRLGAKKSAVITFIFETSSKDRVNEYLLKYQTGINVSGGQSRFVYKNVRIKPVNIDATIAKESIDLNSEKVFLDFKATKLNVHSFKMLDKLEYDGKNCDDTTCYPVKRLLVAMPMKDYLTTLLEIVPTYEWDSKITEPSYSLDNFLLNYGSIRYQYKNNYYESELLNATAPDYPGKEHFFLVHRQILSATKIELVIRTRNQQVSYLLKG